MNPKTPKPAGSRTLKRLVLNRRCGPHKTRVEKRVSNKEQKELDYDVAAIIKLLDIR